MGRKDIALALAFIGLIGSCMSNHGSEKTLQRPSLGEMYSLGTLYDAKTDQVIPGLKLWNSKTLENFKQHNDGKTKYAVMAEEDVDIENSHFDISASMSLSFLAGLIKVTGSAKYLDDRKKTSKTARVSIAYDTRTHVQELEPEVFLKVDMEEVLKKTPATHVVVKIEYGIGAVFVFDQEISEDEIAKDVQGSMKILIKALPGISIDGDGNVTMTEEQRRKTERFSCLFHGDVRLDTDPSNFEEAVIVYKHLPSFVGQNFENSIPMKVYLLPLDLLPITRESELLHTIEGALVEEVTSVLTNLDAFVRRCNDIESTKMIDHHRRVKEKISTFHSYVQVFTLLFKETMAELLPTIRGNGNQSLLVNMLADKEDSPFGKQNLELWMHEAEEETTILTQTEVFPNYCKDKGEFMSKILGEERYTLALVMRLDTNEDLFLDHMKNCLDEAERVRKCNFSPNQRRKKWWNSFELLGSLKQKGDGFKRFHVLTESLKASGFQSDIQFLTFEDVVEKEEATETFKPSVTLKLYENAQIKDPDYQIPSEPGKPEALRNFFNSVQLVWLKPHIGEQKVTQYAVETYVNKNGSAGEKMLVTTTTVKRGSFNETHEAASIFGLKLKTTYFFTIYAFTELGKTSVSNGNTPIATNACPAGMYESDEECRFCPNGEYSQTEGATSCTKCAPGEVNESVGNVNCSLCPEGTYANVHCVPCEPGSYTHIAGAQSCLKCPIGTYGSDFGSKSCTPCPNGQTTYLSGCKYIDDCGDGVNGTIQSTLREFTKNISDWQTATDTKLQALSEWETSAKSQLQNIQNEIDHFHPEKVLVQNHNYHNLTAFQGKLWSDYKSGFGEPNSDQFWIGLDLLHYLSLGGKWSIIFEVVWDKVWIYIQHMEAWRTISDDLKGTTGMVEFVDFKVNSDATNFTASIGGLISSRNWHKEPDETTAPVMGVMNGMQFSLKDRDDDRDDGDCQFGIGWWFNRCNDGNCFNCPSGKALFFGGFWRIPSTTTIWLQRI